MASGVSFKQQCPSCEAMVPIRDAGLIGRKIDCPKCKYRFVVEEPAEDEAPKKGDKAAGKAGKGGAKTAAAKPGAKKKGLSPAVLIGGSLAVVALVALVIALVAMSGKKDDNAGANNPGTGNTGGTGGTGGEDKEKEKEKDKDKDPPPAGALVNITNLLPNDTQAVISYPMPKTFGSAFRALAMDESGAYKGSRLAQQLGLDDLSDLNRVVTALRVDPRDKWVFTVVQTKQGKPLNQKLVKEQFGLVSDGKVKSKGEKEYELFLVNADLDSLGVLLLRANQPGQQFAAHFLDSHTVVFADAAPLRKFLNDDASPEQLTKPGSSTGGGGRPGGGQMGGQIGFPGGNIGRPPQGGGPSPGPGGGPSPGPGGGPSPGPGGGPSPGPGGGPSPGPGGGPPMGMRGGPPMGMMGGPPMGGGQIGGGGQPGGDDMPNDPSAPESYLTVKADLKYILDRIEKIETTRDRKKNLVSVLTLAGEARPFLPTLVTTLGGQALVELDATQRLALRGALNGLDYIGVSVNEFTQDKLEVVAAGQGRSKALAEAFDKFVRPKLTEGLTKAIKDRLGLKLAVKQPTTTPPGGFPGGPGGPGFPGPGGPGFPGRPGGGGPGTDDGGQRPPGGGEGGGDGQKPPDEEKNDGSVTPSVEDKVIVYQVEMLLSNNDTAYSKVADTTRETLHQLRATGEMAVVRPRYHELAKALKDYVKDKSAFPLGAAARSNFGRDIPWRPDQRLSFYAALLPYAGTEYSDWKFNANKGWNEGENLLLARRMVPLLLVQKQLEPNEPFVNYGTTGETLGATHWVGIAGVGLDIAEGNDPATAKQRGIFSFDRITRVADVTDKLSHTIALILTPGDIQAPWLAGGGATVRGVPSAAEDSRPMAGFVCVNFPASPEKKTKYDTKRGTLAIMGDGKVRFLPEDLSAETFRALCTIAGGETIDKLDELCPVIEDPAERVITTPGGGGTPPTGKPKSDLEAMQGTWAPISASRHGVSAPAAMLKSVRLTVTGGKVKVTEPGATHESTFTLDPSKSPKTIDSVDLDGPDKGKKQLGIYEVTAKQLRMCLAEAGATARPTSFNATPQNKWTVMVMERASGGPDLGKKEWKDFSPPSKAFTIKMPGEVTPTKAPGGGQAYVCLQSNGAYTVSVTTLPAEALQLGADKFFEVAKLGLAQAAPGSKVLSESTVKSGTYTGREWTVDLAGKVKTKIRMFLVDKTLIEASVSPITTANEKDAKTFHESLRIGK